MQTLSQPDNVAARPETTSPLIVTLTLDTSASELLSAWRERYFPPERNFLAAHLTLYHALPGAVETWIKAQLAACAAKHQAFTLGFTSLKAHGGFVAVEVSAASLLNLKKELDGVFGTHLVPQDKQPLRPHVTLVNKVTADEGAARLAELQAVFAPFQGEARGLTLHRYAGGPWTFIESYAFAPAMSGSTGTAG